MVTCSKANDVRRCRPPLCSYIHEHRFAHLNQPGRHLNLPILKWSSSNVPTCLQAEQPQHIITYDMVAFQGIVKSWHAVLANNKEAYRSIIFILSKNRMRQPYAEQLLKKACRSQNGIARESLQAIYSNSASICVMGPEVDRYTAASRAMIGCAHRSRGRPH